MKTLSEWKPYRRKGAIELRPYIPGESLTGISVSEPDTPQLGGMIARNPTNPLDQWYVARDYFDQHYERV